MWLGRFLTRARLQIPVFKGSSKTFKKHTVNKNNRSRHPNILFHFQIPKGWDKIFISAVCVDSGKSIAKTSRAVVRNGTCHWPDSMSEFISFYQDVTTKEIEECQYRFVVLMVNDLDLYCYFYFCCCCCCLEDIQLPTFSLQILILNWHKPNKVLRYKYIMHRAEVTYPQPNFIITFS